MNIYVSKRHFLVIGLILLWFFLAACGANSSTITGNNGPGATATEPPTQHCGTIHTLGPRVVATDQKNARDIEDCFWQAYQQCHPATLIYVQGGVDTATTRTFSLKKQNGKCALSDTFQHIIFPRPPISTGNDTCTGLEQQADGLHFLACGSAGDILVPTGTGQSQ
ncbi:MAG TPA: hypothetical protein VGM01_13830 [Ktedonobacteraceae bacterium]